MLYVSVAVIFFFYGNDPIIPFALSLLTLVALYDSNQPTPQKTTGKSRFVHEDQNIHWISVLSNR